MTYPQQPPGAWQDPSAPGGQQPQYADPYAAPTSPVYGPGGTYPTYGYGVPVPPPRPNNTMAIVSLVLSLVGLFCGLTAPAGAIVGHIARKQIRQTGEGGDGMALAGIIVGWIITGLLLAYVAVIAVIAVIGIASSSSSSSY